MSDIIPGTTFVNGQQVNASDLNDLVNNAVIASSIIDHSHLKSSSITDSIFGFPVIATASISDDDYVLVWSATDSAFRRIKKGDLASIITTGLTAGNTTIDATTGNITLAGGNYSQTLGSFSYSNGSGDYFALTGDSVLVGPGMNFLFPTESTAGSASVTNSIALAKDLTQSVLKVYSPDATAQVSLDVYGGIRGIGKNNSDSASLTLSAKKSDSTLRTWYTQSMPTESKLWITPDAQNTNTSGNPAVQLGSSGQAIDLNVFGNINLNGSSITSGGGGGGGGGGTTTGPSAFALSGTTLTMTSNGTGTANFSTNGPTLTITSA